MDDKEFINSIIKEREEAVSFFSSARKQEREIWVVNEFLTNLGLQPNKVDVVASEDEPPDVIFKNARFEVKEIIHPRRLRHAEYKESLRKAREARTVADLFETGIARDITYTELCQLVREHLPEVRSYEPAVKQNLDLLFYVNLEGTFGYVSSSIPAPAEFAPYGWRSICFIAGSLAVVVYASEYAPSFLRSNEGKVARRVNG